MSAPRTNTNTQRRRHRGPLVGMAFVVLFGVSLIGYWVFEEAATSDNTAGNAIQTEDTGPADNTAARAARPQTTEANPIAETGVPARTPTPGSRDQNQ